MTCWTIVSARGTPLAGGFPSQVDAELALSALRHTARVCNAPQAERELADHARVVVDAWRQATIMRQSVVTALTAGEITAQEAARRLNLVTRAEQLGQAIPDVRGSDADE